MVPAVTSSSVAGAVATTDKRSALARFGLVAKGVLYVFLGILAVQFASGDVSSKNVSETSAIRLVAEQPLGKFLLVVLTLGLLALTLWHVVMAFTGDPVQGSETTDKIQYAAKAVGYGGLSIAAIAITADNWDRKAPGGGGGGGSAEQQAADTLMDAPLGRWLVIAVGVAIIAFSLYELYKHVAEREFMERFDSSLPDRATRLVDISGRLGYGARSVVAVIIGVFFMVAGVQASSDKTRGLSGALKALAEQSWGPPLLWLIAIGFVVFGVFCFLEARYRRAT